MFIGNLLEVLSGLAMVSTECYDMHALPKFGFRRLIGAVAIAFFISAITSKLAVLQIAMSLFIWIVASLSLYLRLLPVNVIAILVVACQSLLFASAASYSLKNMPNFERDFYLLVMFVCSAAGGLFIVVEMFRCRRLFISGAIGILICVAMPLSWVYVIEPYRIHFANIEHARDQIENDHTLKSIVGDVDAICRVLGRAPYDQRELENLMGHHMPNVYDDGIAIPIRYFRKDDNSYTLHYETWAADDWIYDSELPEEGWVQYYY